MNEDLIKYLQEQKAEREAKVQGYNDTLNKIAEIEKQIADLSAEKESLVASLDTNAENIIAEIDKINGFIDGLIGVEKDCETPVEETEPVQEEIPVEPVEEKPVVYTPAI